MRSTCFGATSGSNSMVTGPSFSSRISVFPGAGVPAALVIGRDPFWECGSGGGDAGADQLVRVRHRAAAGGAALDLVHRIHAGDDPAPDGVLAIEARGRREHDEELAVRAVRALAAGHTADATDEAVFVGELGRQVGQVTGA